MAISCLDKLEQELNVDVDMLDVEYIRKMKPLITFHDQTSNQLWLDRQLDSPASTALLKETVASMRAAGITDWLTIYTRLAVKLVAPNVALISGRVLLQTLPSKAYDTEATVAHGRLYDTEFRAAGIGRDRFCIKIPCTGPAMNAARILQAEGIQTLGTAVFNVPQAVACSQANCLFISPYLNEIAAHDNRELWPACADPAIDHPMSPRITQMLDAYRRLYQATGRQQPLVKNASYLSAAEGLASGEEGCHSATMSTEVIDELAARPYVESEQPGHGHPKKTGVPDAEFYADFVLPARLLPLLAVDPLNADGKAAPNAYETAVATDYLANGGAALDAVIAADPEAARRLKGGLALFAGAENKSRARIEAALAL